MARNKLFPVCPLCGKDAVRVISTTLRGHCLNRWCICDACGAGLRWIETGKHLWWVRVPTKKRPD